MAVPDLSDLPRLLRQLLERCFALERRWYVAWHPDYVDAVLRVKDAAGLAEWEARGISTGPMLLGMAFRPAGSAWVMFGNKTPTITEVTDSIADLWRALLDDPNGRDLMFGVPTSRRLVFVPPSALITKEAPLASGEFDFTARNDVAELCGQQVGDLYEQMLNQINGSWDRWRVSMTCPCCGMELAHGRCRFQAANVAHPTT